MSQLLLKLAQQAAQDKTLFAWLIQTYGEKQQMSWEQMARSFNLSLEQLAKLALCKRPRPHTTQQDNQQIAAYIGLPVTTLDQIRQRVEGKQTIPQSPAWWIIFKQGMGIIMQKRSLAVALVALIIVLLTALVMAQPTRMEATLVVTEGEAVIVQNGPRLTGSTQRTVFAPEAVVVKAGDEIWVGAAASAQLRLYDGSTVDLFANTALQVTELQTNNDTYRVRLAMLAGKTLSRVERVLGIGDAFEIKTPSSTASVRGTIFTVEIITLESTLFICDEGIVIVQMGSAAAELPAGYQLLAVVGQPLQVQPQGAAMPAAAPELPAAAPLVAEPSPEPLLTPTAVPPTATATATATPTATASATPTATATSTATATATTSSVPTGTATPPGNGGNQLVTICHIPPGNPNNPQTIQVAQSALQAHLDHGDSLGSCPSSTPGGNPGGGNSGNNPGGGNSGNNPGGGNSGNNPGQGNPGGGNSGNNPGGGNPGQGNPGGGQP
ncbi:MAG: FecR domain-containing protein [Anaerolineae bacterium]|nr:FecR domain-containing protein [Anaerolineae bacterium]